MKTVKVVLLVAIIAFLAFVVVASFCGCATSIPPVSTTAEMAQTLTAVEPAAMSDLAPVSDADDAGPRLLAANIKFGQVEREDDCELPEDSVEQHVAYILKRAGVPQPDNLTVKMLRQSSLCEELPGDGFVHLAEIGITMRWRSISSNHFARAKTLMEDMRFVSSILP